MQQRPFSLYDVLSSEEIQTARFYRAPCAAPYRMLPRLPSAQWIDMNDRLSVGVMMRDRGWFVTLDPVTAPLAARMIPPGRVRDPDWPNPTGHR